MPDPDPKLTVSCIWIQTNLKSRIPTRIIISDPQYWMQGCRFGPFLLDPENFHCIGKDSNLTLTVKMYYQVGYKDLKNSTYNVFHLN